MTTKKSVPYQKNKNYQSALGFFQQGEWEPGLAALDAVIIEYPTANDLQMLREEILLKRQLDDDEVIDTKKEQKQKNIRTGIRLGILAVVILVVFWGAQTFSSWIYNQWINIQTGIVTDFQNLELAVQYRDAQSYLLANQPNAAQEIYQQIVEANPNYPGLDTLYTDITNMLGYQARYDEAVQDLENGDSLTALSKFQGIYDEKPDFLDVAVQIQEIKSDLYLMDLLEQAEAAYGNEDWELASSQYESLRAIAADFRTELVEQRIIRSYMNLAAQILESENASLETLDRAEGYFRKVMVLRPRDEVLLTEQNRIKEQFKNRLFDIYVQAAREAVVGQEDSLKALETAKNYFQNALLLKPNDPNIKLEFDVAQDYLQAQIDFEAGLMNQAITNLEFIYDKYPKYANGTAMQTLYESYMTRGDAYSATGELESALIDFQKAAEVASVIENSVLKLYFAKVKVAEVVGILNNYAAAVDNYREAVTLINLESILETQDADLTYLLREAERYADIEWYRTAYRLYRRVLPATDFILDKGEIVIIKEGDYLSSLANTYDTTVQEILNANALPNAANIQMGQEIIIPTLKEIGE